MISCGLIAVDNPLNRINPAEYAGQFYRYFHFRYQSNYYNKNTEDFELGSGLFWPTQRYVNSYLDVSYESSQSKTFKGLVAIAKRHSAKLYSGISLGYERDFSQKLSCYNTELGLIFKPSGNFYFNFKQFIQLSHKNSLSEDNYSEISLTYKPNINLKFDFGVLSTSEAFGEIFCSFRKLNVYVGTGMDFSDRMDYNNFSPYLKIGYELFSTRLNTGIQKRKEYTAFYSSFKYSFPQFYPPIQISPERYPIINKDYEKSGLVLLPKIQELKQRDHIITVEKGDNLIQISRSLPSNALENYKNNVIAICEYNDIKNPQMIKVGQTIKIPIKEIDHGKNKESLHNQALTEKLLNKIYTANFIEIMVNKATWFNKIKPSTNLLTILPNRGGVDNFSLLNIKAINKLKNGDYDKAAKLLKWAIKIKPDSDILKRNLAVALFMKGNKKKANNILKKNQFQKDLLIKNLLKNNE